MHRWANRLLFFLNILVLAGGIYFFGSHNLRATTQGLEYKDLITIILTAIAVLLAAVTIFVAGMAIWGYNTIRDEAIKVAREVAAPIAARESAALSGFVKGSEESDTTDELVAALRDGDGASAKSKRGPREVRRGPSAG